MFDFKHKGCNLDISNLCTLECPKCMRAQWKDKKQIPGSHMTVEQFTKIANYFPYIQYRLLGMMFLSTHQKKLCLRWY